MYQITPTGDSSPQQIVAMKRFDWADIFRGILMILVVVGHATGLFNQWIYQFHVAAFFILSGYLANLNKRSLLETALHGALTLLLPFFSMLILLQAACALLSHLGLYEAIVSNTLPYNGFRHALRLFFETGKIEVWWLGAGWFLLVLFGVQLIQKLIYDICAQRRGWTHFAISALLFFFGYYLVDYCNAAGRITAILTAQMFFAVGVLLRQRHFAERLQHKLPLCGLLIPLCLIYMAVLPHLITSRYTLDLANNDYGLPIWVFIGSLNGALLMLCLSILLSAVPVVKQVLISLGRNTLGILCLHIVFFNLAYLVLYLLGIVPISYLGNFLPTEEIGANYWWLITAISLLGSLGLWKLMTAIPPLRFLLGASTQTNQRICSAFSQWRPIRWLNSLIGKLRLPQPRQNRWKEMSKTDKRIILGLIVLGVVALYPIWKFGVMQNDELQMWASRRNGIFETIATLFQREVFMGRLLRVMFDINAAVGQIGSIFSAGFSRLVQLLTLGSAFAALGYFLSQLLQEKKRAYFAVALALIFLPITFEASAPNVFTAPVALPMAELFLSMGLYCKYCRGHKRSTLVGAAILYVIALLGYEFIVTYIPLYALIRAYLGPKEKRVSNVIRGGLLTCMAAMIFIVLYFSIQKMLGSGYDGVQIGNVTLAGAAKILWTLFKSALPGYYLFNAKYVYLRGVYANADNISAGGIVRLLLMAIICIILLAQIIRPKEKRRRDVWIVSLLALAYAFVPSLPNSIASMYQGIVNETSFTSLPVSLYLYVAVIVAASILIWEVALRIRERKFAWVCACAICIYAVPVQYCNNIFSEVMTKDFSKLTSFETILTTDFATVLDGQSVYSADLFKTNNALAIHDSYWQDLSRTYGLETTYSRENTAGVPGINVYRLADNKYVFVAADALTVVSPSLLSGTWPLQIDETSFIGFDFTDISPVKDHQSYIYNLSITADGLQPAAMGMANIRDALTGSTLETAANVSGLLDDGWVGPKLAMDIKVLDSGIIFLEGYYPLPLDGSQTIAAYINDTIVDHYTLTEQSFSLAIPAPANEIVHLTIEASFSGKASDSNDQRSISFVFGRLYSPEN